MAGLPFTSDIKFVIYVSAAKCADNFEGIDRNIEENGSLKVTCEISYSGIRTPVFSCLSDSVFEVVTYYPVPQNAIYEFTTNVTRNAENLQIFTCNLKFDNKQSSVIASNDSRQYYHWTSLPVTVTRKFCHVL